MTSQVINLEWQENDFKEILNPKAMDQIHWNVDFKTGFLIEHRVTKFHRIIMTNHREQSSIWHNSVRIWSPC